MDCPRSARDRVPFASPWILTDSEVGDYFRFVKVMFSAFMPWST